MSSYRIPISERRDKPLYVRKNTTVSKTKTEEQISVAPVEIIPAKNPIYNQVIKLINENYDEEIVFRNICRYIRPGSYNVKLRSNFGLNDDMIIDLLKISAAKNKNLLAILIIKYYQLCMFNYDQLIYNELPDICVKNNNKDLLIWIAKSTYDKKISKKIYEMADRLH